ncbi:hypothetical protein HU200_066321 [Digitaria exilis]|uniref:F-box associated beta-propeller type 3 domain-containing protein n=1 Tax=Digitaria exilis TaxID=1010633 RepID=A0A835A0F9_9POAL|nr:hypothetical protein HU200_066321 [Digitaria exilis]CAB3452258.1 unnamed protein product [Digitaria exilis]
MASSSSHMDKAAGAPATTRSKGLSLLVAAVRNHKDIYRVDLKLIDAASGALVGKMDGQRIGKLLATGGLICHVPTHRTTLRVLNPATGSVNHVPAGTTTTTKNTVGHDAARQISSSSYVLGQIPNTIEYKVLRIYTPDRDYRHTQSCEILTLDGSGDYIWRPAQSPLLPVDTSIARHGAVAQGFVHFFMALHGLSISRVGKYNGIASFDLAKEEWKPSLLPTPITVDERNCNHDSLSLVELNGCLVFVYHDYLNFCINLWMLEDLAKGKWLKMECIQFGSVMLGWREPDKSLPVTLRAIQVRWPGEIFALPLMVLDDGCIVFWVQHPYGAVRVFDPKTRGYKNVVNMGKICNIFGKYKTGQVGFTL